MNRYRLLAVAAVLASMTGCGDDSTNKTSSAVCGNQIVEVGEACDDGNTNSDDGCSADCSKIEEGFSCPMEGGDCEEEGDTPQPTPKPNCGNRMLDSGEVCDDGNTNSGDGCSADCSAIEEGYQCLFPGVACLKIDTYQPMCGDGILNDNEACDDGNTKDGDGCSADCSVIEEGYICQTEGYDCMPMGCGNGITEEGETCDDGLLNVSYLVNGVTEGCSFACQKAHYCGDGLLDRVDRDHGEECDRGAENVPVENDDYDICTTSCKHLRYCGDGYVDPGEICDDGNTTSGDGCSADCSAFEEGFSCEPVNGKTYCTPLSCGNGVTEPDKMESCDDGNRLTGDGCGADCQVEKGYLCTPDALGRAMCTKVCGNGILETDATEGCDDGNLNNGDGCSNSCEIENGWKCRQDDSGKSVCQSAGCGDGVVVPPETCDDGNTKSGDGCSVICKRETGFHCPENGGKCEPDKCGDGIVTGDEQCDEGANATAGCVACKIQKDWECLTPGTSCTKTAVCGDGILQGSEECDEGTEKTKGCIDCAIADGYRCPHGAGKACIKGNCGDGQLDKGEECDDGNSVAGDGCSPICEIEPIFECSGVTCRPMCGDGLTLTEAGEECDDGNLLAGDGCSPDCKIEEGFACVAPGKFETWPATLTLPITYRDFVKYNGQSQNASSNPMPDGFLSKSMYDNLPASCKGTKNGYRTNYPLEIGKPSPDFNSYCPDSKCEGNVKPLLGSDGKPELQDPKVSGSFHLAEGRGEACVHLYTCPEVFKWWYQDVSGINRRYDATLTLSHKGNGRYEYESGSFLPIAGLTDVGGQKGYTGFAGNGEFTSEFHTYFKYNGGETLTFNGDDDVWVFMNGRLAVDVGGIHPAWTKSINLDQRAEELHMYKGGIYALDMFHAERCLGGSSFRLTLTGFMQMGKSTCTTTCGDGIVAGGEQCDIKGHVDDETAKKAGCVRCQFQPFCGNGKIETGEGCDQGEINSDWCVNCKIATCGNNALDDHEQCDAVNGKFVFAGKTEEESQSLKCNMCRVVGCGDGIVDSGEECDDGNTINDDTCSNTCKRPTCGDGIVQKWLGEVCDDGINDGTYGHCGLGCSYMPPFCGDGIVDSVNGELCDNGTNNGTYNTCNPDCTLPEHCGDGIVQAEFEQCDEGAENGTGKCSTSCTTVVN